VLKAKVATPEVTPTLDAKITEVVWSVNVTVPVGVPPVEETVAVKVNDWPYDGDEGERVTTVVVAIEFCVIAVEVLVLKLASPE